MKNALKSTCYYLAQFQLQFCTDFSVWAKLELFFAAGVEVDGTGSTSSVDRTENLMVGIFQLALSWTNFSLRFSFQFNFKHYSFPLGFCSTIPEVYQINAAWGGWLNGKANAKWFHAKNNLHSPVCAAAHIFASLNQSDGHFLFAFVPKG